MALTKENAEIIRALHVEFRELPDSVKIAANKKLLEEAQAYTEPFDEVQIANILKLQQIYQQYTNFRDNIAKHHALLEQVSSDSTISDNDIKNKVEFLIGKRFKIISTTNPANFINQFDKLPSFIREFSVAEPAEPESAGSESSEPEQIDQALVDAIADLKAEAENIMQFRTDSNYENLKENFVNLSIEERNKFNIIYEKYYSRLEKFNAAVSGVLPRLSTEVIGNQRYTNIQEDADYVQKFHTWSENFVRNNARYIAQIRAQKNAVAPSSTGPLAKPNLPPPPKMSTTSLGPVVLPTVLPAAAREQAITSSNSQGRSNNPSAAARSSTEAVRAAESATGSTNATKGAFVPANTEKRGSRTHASILGRATRQPASSGNAAAALSTNATAPTTREVGRLAVKPGQAAFNAALNAKLAKGAGVGATVNVAAPPAEAIPSATVAESAPLMTRSPNMQSPASVEEITRLMQKQPVQVQQRPPLTEKEKKQHEKTFKDLKTQYESLVKESIQLMTKLERAVDERDAMKADKYDRQLSQIQRKLHELGNYAKNNIDPRIKINISNSQQSPNDFANGNCAGRHDIIGKCRYDVRQSNNAIGLALPLLKLDEYIPPPVIPTSAPGQAK